MHLGWYSVALAVAIFGSIRADTNYDDYSSEEVVTEPCDSSNCLLPNCSCFRKEPPRGFRADQTPQLVMLTFDDAVTMLNVKTYRLIADGRTNSNGCPVTATFFVSHQYNDYEFVNEMYRKGHDIAVHSITHESSTDMWKSAPQERWANEMSGMRRILEKHAQLPSSEIRGHRAPFLQTAGDTTFRMLRDRGFQYDSSMPTRMHMDPPLWPYTLDYGYQQDCQIQPCPKALFPGLWIFPMVQWRRTHRTKSGNATFHCSMVDACTPYPTTEKDTFDFFVENFDRHYTTNRAPFPVFLHEAWLHDKRRLKGYLSFLDHILRKDDVFVVSMREVLEYMRNPVALDEYKTRKPCFSDTRPKAGSCSSPLVCNYPKRNVFMKSCVPCPKRYPWLGNPEGDRTPKADP